MLSRLGEELRSDHNRTPRPVTMPPIHLPDLDDRAIEAETRQAQARVRVIRAGRDAWEAIAKAQSFDGLLAIGAALSIGKRHALKVTGANRAWGRAYSREVNLWIKAHGFERMPAPPGAWLSSYTSTPRRSPHGATRYRNGSVSGSFIRYRSQDAGEPLQRTTASVRRIGNEKLPPHCAALLRV
jgi:hypothetical protein